MAENPNNEFNTRFSSAEGNNMGLPSKSYNDFMERFTPPSSNYEYPALIKSISSGEGVKVENGVAIPNSLDFSGLAPTYKGFQFSSPTPNLTPVQYDVRTSAIYDRLSDGSYIPKFENYQGAVGNEDRLAKDQSGWEQAWNGLSKNVVKTFNYALDATVGTVYGLVNAAYEGDFSKFYDNDFSKTLDDWNKKLDNNLANYYTDEQKSQGFLRSLFSVNFWANDFLGGMAFVGGSLLPELALGAITGGATLAGSGAKFGLKQAGESFLKTVGKEAAEEILDPTNYIKRGKTILGGSKETVDMSKLLSKVQEYKTLEGGIDILKGVQRANYYKTAGSIADTGLFLARTSAYEAGMEARQNLKESVENYTNDFYEREGRMPSVAELSKFTEEATAAANGVFAANMAILSVSNAAMFGKAFNVKLPNIGDRISDGVMGIGTKTLAEDAVKLTAKEVSKPGKIFGSVYNILRKPVIEGVYEEGLQGVAGKTMQNYLDAKYDPKQENSYSFLNSLGEALSEQYGTKEGWKEMGIGMLIGFAGGLVQPAGRNEDGTKQSFSSRFPGLGSNSRQARVESLGKDIDKVNYGVDTLRGMNRASSVRAYRNSMDNNPNDPTLPLTDAMADMQFIESQQGLKTKSQIVDDYTAVIAKMDLADQFSDLSTEEAAEAEKNYKTAAINNFQRNLNNYRSVANLVEDLPIPATIESDGNRIEVKDAVKSLLYAGISSRDIRQTVAQDIEKLIGRDGFASALNFTSELEESKLSKIQELKTKNSDLRRARDLAIKYAQQLAGVTPSTLDNNTKDTRYKKYSEKSLLAQQRVLELENEIETIGNDINNSILVTDTPMPVSYSDLIDSLDAYDNYAKALKRAGRNTEAQALESKLATYKTYTNAHLQAQSTLTRMLDTDFFSSKEGKGLVDSIIGKKYKVSNDFRNSLRENEELVSRALNRFGLSDLDAVKNVVDSLEQNNQLSEREKYKLESIMLTMLGAESIDRQVSDIFEEIVAIDPNKAVDDNLVTGDTITLLEQVNLKEQDINNIDKLTEAINLIMAEVNKVRKNTRKARELTRLNNRLKELQNGPIQEQLPTEVDVRQQTETGEEIPGGNPQREKITQEIEEVKKEIEEVEASAIDAITPEEYKRFSELSKKKVDKTISDPELEEFQQLRDDIDSWTLITGTITNGLRLSDLMFQREMLKSLQVTDKSLPTEISVQEIIDSVNLDTVSRANNYDYTLGFYSVQTSYEKDTGRLKLSGIMIEDFLEELNVNYAKKSAGVYKVVIGSQSYNITTDDKNAIYLTGDVVDAININTPVSIAATNRDLSTGYSIVYVKNDVDEFASPMPSTYRNYLETSMDPEDAYSMREGESIRLEIDPNDETNKRILSPLRNNKTIPKEVKDKMVSDRYEAKVLSSSELLNLELELKSINADTNLTTLQKNKKTDTANKKIERLKARFQKESLADVNSELKTVVSKKDVLKEAAEQLVIHVVNQQGERVQILKGVREGGITSSADKKFKAIRDKIGNDEDFLTRLITTQTSDFYDVGDITVNKLLLGHPTLNILKNEDGTSSIEYRNISEADADKIVDIGYSENGKLYLRGSVSNTRAFFTGKKPGKTPVIVFEKGGQRIAYPVRIASTGKPSIDEFKTVYESDIRPVDKVTSLNRILAQSGIDPTLPGEGFVIAGVSNLTDEFFNNKLAQLEQISYFYNLDNWLDKSADMKSIITEQILTNIDLSNPIHSPKLKLDYSKVNVGENLNVETVNSSVTSKLAGAANRANTVVNGEINEELNKSC